MSACLGGMQPMPFPARFFLCFAGAFFFFRPGDMQSTPCHFKPDRLPGGLPASSHSVRQPSFPSPSLLPQQ